MNHSITRRTAAIASKRRVGVAELDIAELQATLKQQRVDLTGPTDLT